ncbi:MAG TPA: VacJ family lipoprotein [Candidatus Binatia bacterium]
MTTDGRLAGLGGALVIFLAALALSLGSGRTARAEEEQSVPTESLETEAPSGFVGYIMLNEAEAAALDAEAEQDPWERFNEPMFRFNRGLDRHIIKPVATAWDAVFPDPIQRGMHNAIDNLFVVRRVVNNAFQLKWNRALKEVGRFTINTTIGFAGFVDVAKDGMGIQQSDEDFGQTLGFWGAKTGPYLILPLYPPPLTIRDGVGNVMDALMNPLSYILPWGAKLGILTTDGINERSLNLTTFQRVEESVVDLYSAVRNAYLQRRAAAIRE